MKKQVSVIKLYEFLKTKDDDVTEPGNVSYMFCEMNDELRYFLRHVFLFGLEEDSLFISYDPNYFNVIEQIANQVIAEYECEETWDCDAVNLWSIFNLSGDDDVDYNGSYILTAIDWLRSYEHDNN